MDKEQNPEFLLLSEFISRKSGKLLEPGITKPAKVSPYLCGDHPFKPDDSCPVCNQPGAIYKKVVYKFPIINEAQAEYTSEKIKDTLTYMIKFMLAPRSRGDLSKLTNLVCATSALMIKVRVANLPATKYAYKFAPPPPNVASVICSMMIYSSRRHYSDVSIVITDGIPETICSGCGAHYTYWEAAAMLNIKDKNVPFSCLRCKDEVRIDSRFGEFGFHETHLAGHSRVGVAKLLGHFVRETVNQPYEPSFFPMLSNALKIMHSDCIPHKYGSVDPPDFLEHTVVDTKFTSPGVVVNLPPGVKKYQLSGAMNAYITDMIHEMDQVDGLADKYRVATSRINNLMQTSVKQEVRAAPYDFAAGAYYAKEGERMFFIVNFLLTTLIRMIMGPFSSTGGVGTPEKNVPSAVGMSFFGESAIAFVSEMTKMKASDLNFVSSKDQLDFKLATLNKTILDKWIIAESDISKWDVSMLASLLSSVSRSFLPFFKMRKDYTGMNFMAIFARYIECHKYKVFNCPSGEGWYAVASSMMSGSWDTSFMNTMCNYVSQVVCIMEIMPGFFERSDYHDHISIKVFGDDNLSFYSRKHGDGRVGDGLFTEEDLKKLPEVMERLFRFKIPEDEFVLHKQFVNVTQRNAMSTDRVKCPVHASYVPSCGTCQGRYDGTQYPTFLKFKLGLVPCKRCTRAAWSSAKEVVYHWVFIREGYKTLPKLFLDSGKEMSPEKLKAKLIGYVWTVGANIGTYRVLKEIWDINMKELPQWSDLDVVPNDLTEISMRFDIANDFWAQTDFNEFPDYDVVIDRMVCPALHGSGPYKTKSVAFYASYGGFVRYQNWEEMRHIYNK
jgi:hypothetical protein